MMNDVEITADELEAEYARLDTMRGIDTRHTMNDEQFKLIHYARTGDGKVTWMKLAKYWEERGWGKIPRTTLTTRYDNEKQRRGLI